MFFATPINPKKYGGQTEDLMTQSRLNSPTRRNVLKSAALGSVAAIAAPYVRDSYAAGSLSLGVWDHWVPGANNTFTKLCNEWGAKNNCEVKIDYITSQGEKDKLTAAAEAQAGTGHDIMSHRDWNVRIHQNVLEPLDDVADGLMKQYGPISPVAEYLAKIKGTWRGIPTTVGSQVKPCCSRFDLYQHLPGRRVEVGQGQDRYLDLGHLSHVGAEAARRRLPGRLAHGPDVRRGRLGRRAVQLLRRGHGRRQGQHQGQLRRDPRGARIHEEADGGEPAGSLCLGRRRQQSLADFRQGLQHHEPAERLGGRQARQSDRGGELLDPSDAEGPEGPLRRPTAAVLWPVVVLEEQVRGERPADLYLAEGICRPIGPGVVRLRLAVVQDHVRSR